MSPRRRPASAQTADVIAATSAHDYDTPALGGPGGGGFRIVCPFNQFLVGVHLRFGDWTDSVDAICMMFRDDRWTVPPERQNTPAGGSGGGRETDVMCPRDMLARGLKATRTRGGDKFVANVGLVCARPAASASGDVTVWQRPSVNGADEIGQIPVACKTDTRWYYYAKGIQGRAGVYVDALGLACSGFEQVMPARHRPWTRRHILDRTIDTTRGGDDAVPADQPH